MGPVAKKLQQELRRARRANLVDLGAVREARELFEGLDEPIPEIDGLPANHRLWMQTFKLLVTLMQPLLGSKALRKIGPRIDVAEEEYMPGGPPMSPILDSVFMSWWMADLPVGIRRETCCSILADVGATMGMAPELKQAARIFGESRLGIYQVREVGPSRVALRELGGEQEVEAELPDDLTGRSPLWLTRLLPPLIPRGSELGRLDDALSPGGNRCRRAVGGVPRALPRSPTPR